MWQLQIIADGIHTISLIFQHLAEILEFLYTRPINNQENIASY